MAHTVHCNTTDYNIELSTQGQYSRIIDLNWLVWQVCCGLCGQHSWVSYNNREVSKEAVIVPYRI